MPDDYVLDWDRIEQARAAFKDAHDTVTALIHSRDPATRWYEPLPWRTIHVRGHKLALPTLEGERLVEPTASVCVDGVTVHYHMDEELRWLVFFGADDKRGSCADA